MQTTDLNDTDDSTPTTPSISFASTGLSTPLLQALTELGYETPSAIQAQAIPLLLSGENLLGVAQTGTGKTAAFALPLLTRITTNNDTPAILVLTPTRELAIQVAEAFQAYAKNLPGFKVLPIYGGSDIRHQLQALKKGVDVVVGTPGRTRDLIERKRLKFENLQAVVLDEADEMLRMGFIEDVEFILAATPENCQRALFSATMPGPIKRVADTYLHDAREVRIAAKTRTVERIEQNFLIVNHGQKLDALTRFLEVEPFDGVIIFVRTRSETVELAEKLDARGYTALAINGDMAQALREQTINRFKSGRIDILVATDVAARGLDVDRISHVVNYDIPHDPESYVHRIGRTGRAGRSGRALLFVTPKERRLLKSIERSNRQALSPLQLPTGEQVSEKRIDRFEQQLMETLHNEELDEFRQLVEQFAHNQERDIGDIAAALLMQGQKERPLFPLFAPLPDQQQSRQRGNQGERKQRSGNRAYRDDKNGPKHKKRGSGARLESGTRYRIEVGRKHGVEPRDIVGALANEGGIDGSQIGNISIQGNFSTVELPGELPKGLISHLKKVRIRQVPTQISLQEERPKFGGKRESAKKRKNRKAEK